MPPSAVLTDRRPVDGQAINIALALHAPDGDWRFF